MGWRVKPPAHLRFGVAAAWWLGLEVAMLAGCGRQPAPDARASTRPSATRAAAEVEDLMALPYAGWSEDDDARDGLVLCDTRRSQPGYTLISVFGAGRAILVSHDGAIMRTWDAPNHVNLLPNGDLVTLGADPAAGNEAPAHRFIKRMSWTGETIWRRDFPAHHEIAPATGGRLMVLTYKLRPAGDLHEDPSVQLRDNEIVLLTPDGEPIESVSIYDLIRGRLDLFPLKSRRVAKSRNWIDLLHCNSLQWITDEQLLSRGGIYGPDNVLFCSRHQDRVAIVNMRTRELVWAWGAAELSGPHDAQVLPSGNILLLDNGLKLGHSRAVEVDPHSGEIVWQFVAPNPPDFFTPGKGSVQRLANGNTLIGNADSGEVFEVTPEGDVVWRYLCPDRDAAGRRATIVRARRFDAAIIERLEAEYGE